ncbi:hypothetical protein BDR26DRAFT_1016852 [Obelidium mucronatum]|nr:hypothetical protein BDR26DRAFT_1016852 [Obelidium mucronatum]
MNTLARGRQHARLGRAQSSLRRCVSVRRIVALLLLASFSLSVFFLQAKSRPTNSRSSAISPPVLNEFEFIPPLHTHPPAKRAVITLLAGPAKPTQLSKSLDDFCLLAHYQAYSFLHGNITNLNNNNNNNKEKTPKIEFVVMATYETPVHCLEGLLKLGVSRIIKVPTFIVPSEMNHRYGYTFTKFRMWALEGIYESILTMDGDMFFLKKSPLDLFDFMTRSSVSSLGKRFPFFGAVKDWPGGADYESGQFDSGLMLFEPTIQDYKGLLDTIPSSLGFGDQRVLTKYYNSQGARPFTVIPHYYHTSRLLERTKQEIEEAVGLHFKFLTIKLDNASTVVAETRELFGIWSNQMQDLRRIQMKDVLVVSEDSSGYEEADQSLPVVPIVPVVPKLFDEWQLVRTHNSTMYDTVLVVSLESDKLDPVELGNRNKLASLYHQSTHLLLSPSLSAFLKIASALEKFEWVWILAPHVSVDAKVILSVAIGQLQIVGQQPMLIGFKDCKNTSVANSASILLHKSSRLKLLKYLETFSASSTTAAADQIWAGFTSLFGVSEKRLVDSTSLYTVAWSSSSTSSSTSQENCLFLT